MSMLATDIIENGAFNTRSTINREAIMILQEAQVAETLDEARRLTRSAISVLALELAEHEPASPLSIPPRN